MARRRETRRGTRRRGGETRPGTGAAGPDPRLGMEPLHLALLGGGILVAVVAFWLLARGSVSAAPLLLVLAYLVLIPIALVLPARGKKGRDPSDGS